MNLWAKPVGWMTPNAKAANKTMSGLDGLGWPNPEDEPKPKKTMNSQLEIKLAPTPETDAMEYFDAMCDPDRVVEADFARKLERERDQFSKTLGEVRAILCDALPNENQLTSFMAATLERERDEWKAKYIQQNKDLGCEMMDPNGTIWDYAKKVQRELTVVIKQRDQLEGRLRVELGGHPDSKLWGDAGLIAATMRCVDALDTATEQRDRLAEALRKLADCDWVITPHDRMDAVREIARKALQSLTPNEKP